MVIEDDYLLIQLDKDRTKRQNREEKEPQRLRERETDTATLRAAKMVGVYSRRRLKGKARKGEKRKDMQGQEVTEDRM